MMAPCSERSLAFGSLSAAMAPMREPCLRLAPEWRPVSVVTPQLIRTRIVWPPERPGDAMFG